MPILGHLEAMNDQILASSTSIPKGRKYPNMGYARYGFHIGNRNSDFGKVLLYLGTWTLRVDVAKQLSHWQLSSNVP